MKDTLFDITGKKILITGSSGGIGKSLAENLGKRGATIILNGRDPLKLDLAKKELSEKHITAYASCFDVTDKEGIRNALNALAADIDQIDVLINNAGIQIRGPLEDFPEEDWTKILSVNLTGVFLVTQQVVKQMIQRRSGKIINICSLQCELGRPTIAPYAASKGGVRMLTKSMAAEWAKHNIQANGIGPGYFITEMTGALAADETFDTWIKKRTPAGRWGNVDELAGAAVFFSSSASDFVNGQILYIDGGLSSVI